MVVGGLAAVSLGIVGLGFSMPRWGRSVFGTRGCGSVPRVGEWILFSVGVKVAFVRVRGAAMGGVRSVAFVRGGSLGGLLDFGLSPVALTVSQIPCGNVPGTTGGRG